MRLLRSKDYRAMPWKNGGGVTTEIAVSPESAGLADFDWRVSMARVDGDGPFSAFPGVDRTLAVLEGDGIRLTIGDREPMLLTCDSEPFAFPADEPTHGALRGGPICDLNVMVRRGRMEADVRRIEINSAFELVPSANWTLVLINRGRVALGRGEVVDKLQDKDCVVSGPTDGWLTFDPGSRAELFLIEISSRSG